MFSYNPFATLTIDDEDATVEKETDVNMQPVNPISYVKNHNPVCNNSSKINNYPGNDKMVYQKPIHVLGNSDYASMTRSGKKVLILSASLCSRIRMKDFNSFLQNCYAYRKAFSGANADHLAHHCIPTLLEDKPDICIINAGTNS